MSKMLALPAQLSTDTARSLFAEFETRRGQDLAVTARQVTFVGGLCFQILMAARQQWQRDGHLFSFEDVSTEFEAEMARLGFPLGTAAKGPGT